MLTRQNLSRLQIQCRAVLVFFPAEVHLFQMGHFVNNGISQLNDLSSYSQNMGDTTDKTGENTQGGNDSESNDNSDSGSGKTRKILEAVQAVRMIHQLRKQIRNRLRISMMACHRMLMIHRQQVT